MKSTSLREHRNQDLYKSYLAAVGSDRTFSSIAEAADFARLQPAPMFYIEGRTAAQTIKLIESRISLIGMHPLMRKRIWKLYDDYRQYIAENGEQRSITRAMNELVVRPAPEFYISAEHARHIIINERAAAKKRRGLA